MSKTRRVQWLERALHLLDDLAGCAERGQFTRTEALSLIELCKSSPLTSTGEISEMWDVWMKLFGADEIPEQTELASSLRRAEEQVRALQTVTAVRDVAYTEVSSEPPLDAEVQDETDLGPSVQELRRHRSREGLERARAEHVEIKRGWFAQKKGSGAPNPIDLLRREMCMNRKRRQRLRRLALGSLSCILIISVLAAIGIALLRPVTQQPVLFDCGGGLVRQGAMILHIEGAEAVEGVCRGSDGKRIDARCITDPARATGDCPRIQRVQ